MEANRVESTRSYARFAGLFAYPDTTFADAVGDVQAFLDGDEPAASSELREFTDYVQRATLEELQELYTRSFDVQAVTTLDIGYVLFGDDYKRGELLAKLSAECHQAGVDCGTELADHLPNMLRLLDAMQDSDLRDELVRRIIVPALRKVIAEFDPKNVEKKGAIYKKHHKTLIERSEQYGVFYVKPLRALFAILERDFDCTTDEATGQRRPSRFLDSIGNEMKLECNKGKCHGSPG